MNKAPEAAWKTESSPVKDHAINNVCSQVVPSLMRGENNMTVTCGTPLRCVVNIHYSKVKVERPLVIISIAVTHSCGKVTAIISQVLSKLLFRTRPHAGGFRGETWGTGSICSSQLPPLTLSYASRQKHYFQIN